MADDDATTDATAEVPAATTEPVPTSTPPTVDQESFNRIVAREKAEAARQATKRLLEEAGVPTLEALKAMTKAQSDRAEAEKSELQRAVDAAKAEMEAAKNERATIAMERHSLTVERTLSAAGARGDLARLGRLLDVEPGADVEAIKAAVEDLKADSAFASLFGGPATPPSSEPSGGGAPSRTARPEDALSRGAARAEAFNKGTHIPNF